MNSFQRAYFAINFAICAVWMINGLICKLLNLIPRHQQIVARIVGEDDAILLTKAIGVSEILMVVWILSGIKARWCAITQIVVVALMNSIEFFRVPDLLLFGKFNAAVALFFILVIYYNEFFLHKRIATAT